MTKVGLISTLDTNLGDDLIRLGTVELLQSVLGEWESLEFVVMNKHRPLDIFRNKVLPRFVEQVPRKREAAIRLLGHAVRPLRLSHVFDDVDFVVQCGTPMMWPECRRAEWLPTLWSDTLARPRSPRVLSLAAGSCYPWTAPRPPRIQPPDAAALSRMLDVVDTITFRDELAQTIAKSLGFRGRVLPCVALHWAHGRVADPNAEAIVLNVMPRGGHFLWTEDLVSVDWPREMDRLVSALERTHPLILLCHNREEYDFAARWPHHERCLPATAQQYFETIRRACVGVVNRMHAAVALAGVGIPAVAVGTDTRLLMVGTAGQKCAYLADTCSDALLETVNTLLKERWAHRLTLLQNETLAFDEHSKEVAGFVGQSVR